MYVASGVHKRFIAKCLLCVPRFDIQIFHAVPTECIYVDLVPPSPLFSVFTLILMSVLIVGI